MNLLGFQPFIVDVVEQRLCMSGHRNIRCVAEHAGVVGEQEDPGCWQELREESCRPECAVLVRPRLARMI